MDPSTVQPPNWKFVRAPVNSRYYLDLVARERDNYQQTQKRAVEKIYYLLSQRDKTAALQEMQRIAARYSGSHIGEKARQILEAQRSAQGRSSVQGAVIRNNFR